MQLSIFGTTEPGQIVNVASVPQRSPFRYPGGKTWLVPRIRQWLKSLPELSNEFIEPFAGGGIISLTVAFENLSRHVTMVELDDEVAAVWRTIIYGDGIWLADQIATFDCTSDNLENILSANAQTSKEKAFRTILRNRVNHGGILAPGSGLVKYGENGKGILSRWYPTTLKRRILNIISIKERLTFLEGDGIQLLKENSERTDVVFFIDPPYTASGKKAGTRLYKYSEIDHEELFKIASTLKGNFLMTYDNAEEVIEMARTYEFNTRVIAMKNTHNTKMTELLIGRNLDWLK